MAHGNDGDSVEITLTLTVPVADFIPASHLLSFVAESFDPDSTVSIKRPREVMLEQSVNGSPGPEEFTHGERSQAGPGDPECVRTGVAIWNNCPHCQEVQTR